MRNYGCVAEYEREEKMANLTYKSQYRPYNYSERDDECALDEDDREDTSPSYAA